MSKEKLILVGFGKSDMGDLVTLIGTEDEEQIIHRTVHSPPRWRRESICSKEDLEYLKTYTEWLTKRLKQSYNKGVL